MQKEVTMYAVRKSELPHLHSYLTSNGFHIKPDISGETISFFNFKGSLNGVLEFNIADEVDKVEDARFHLSVYAGTLLEDIVTKYLTSQVEQETHQGKESRSPSKSSP